MYDFIPGQRWISDTELHMGLGTVLSVDHRSVTIVFLATGETRIYAKETAPLTRVSFTPGEVVLSHEGWRLKIETIKEFKGLLIYQGTRQDTNTKVELEEGKLDNFIQLNRPSDRLFTGKIDKDKWFELRFQTLTHVNRLSHSDLRGLAGIRTSLIPHQLYIAHEVASRYAPRVLLADEVGLGKTIEAGLILHHQLLSERAKRILIIVPETLIHQWLVEMLRRFNLHFSIFDEDRFDLETEQPGHENPFHSEQLVLCSLNFLVKQPLRFQQALAGDWDILVVDEAHHLQWTPQAASVEYEIIEKLAKRIKGVLLLTATPEQLGKASHFARLRLLDPSRFPDFDSFLAEEKSYEPIAQAVEELLSKETLSTTARKTLQETVKELDNKNLLATLNDATADAETISGAKSELVEHLLDRHGTGRVLFRNTRASVKGFPNRVLSTCPVPYPQQYAAAFDPQNSEIPPTRLLLCPEVHYQLNKSDDQPQWGQIDPRVNWLLATLKRLKPHKVLVIAAHAQTVLDLAEALRTSAGIHAPVFHEGLSIVERDRAAAYFADTQYGSQVLLCSEIGSEGRNFQFAQHLVLFDLPLNPDLLEQRIGRLDRIGQSDTIHIHVPYLAKSAQEVMYRWYHEGLSAFEHTCPAGHTVYTQIEPALIELLGQSATDGADLAKLIEATRKLHHELNEALHRGRDRLLEYNSCRHQIANSLKDRALQLDGDSALNPYMELIFDCYGVELEEDTDTSYIIRPSGHMQTGSFPGLSEDGLTITYDRATALANEDMSFLTWEHPLVTGAMEMVLSNEMGNTAVVAIKNKDLKPGAILVECIHVLESATSEFLQTKRYLPPTVVRTVIDINGQDRSDGFTHEHVNKFKISVDTETAKKVVRTHAQKLRKTLPLSEDLARKRSPEILEAAHQHATQALEREINRLKALHLVNPNVREEEIRFFESQLRSLTKVLDSATPRLDAIRVIAGV